MRKSWMYVSQLFCARICFAHITTMPVLFKKVEVRFDLGVLTEHRLVEFNPESRSRGKGKITVYNFRYTRCCLFHPRICKVFEVFLNHKVRCTSRHMQCCGGADGTTYIMRGKQHVINIRPGGQPAGERKPTKVGN